MYGDIPSPPHVRAQREVTSTIQSFNCTVLIDVDNVNQSDTLR
jgi:hypothetical protein